MDDRIILRACLDVAWNCVDIIGHAEPKNNTITVVSGYNIDPDIPQGTPIEPFMCLSTADAQVLMNDLWNSGFRPQDCRATNEMLALQKRHLDDMRAIVEHNMEIKLP